MKIYFTLDENNKVSSYYGRPMITDGEPQYSIETDIDFNKIKDCHYVNGQLVYNFIYENERQLNKIRQRREVECFTIINRGQLWYNTLTEEQLQELQEWYQQWLDVTKTLIIPELPQWLK